MVKIICFHISYFILVTCVLLLVLLPLSNKWFAFCETLPPYVCVWVLHTKAQAAIMVWGTFSGTPWTLCLHLNIKVSECYC